MPVHNWTPDRGWMFWSLRVSWLVHLADRLNHGVLPDGYSAYIDVTQRPDGDRVDRRTMVRHGHPGTVVAHVEIANPRDKGSAAGLAAWAERITASLRSGIHVTAVDILPAAPGTEGGIHDAVWQSVGQGGPNTDARSLSVVAYAVGDETCAYLGATNVGRPIPDMPLFLDRECYVELPLEETYMTGFTRLPADDRTALGG